MRMFAQLLTSVSVCPSSKFGKFLAIIFSNILSLSLFLFFWNSDNMNVDYLVIVPRVTKALLIFSVCFHWVYAINCPQAH